MLGVGEPVGIGPVICRAIGEVGKGGGFGRPPLACSYNPAGRTAGRVLIEPAMVCWIKYIASIKSGRSSDPRCCVSARFHICARLSVGRPDFKKICCACVAGRRPLTGLEETKRRVYWVLSCGVNAGPPVCWGTIPVAGGAAGGRGTSCPSNFGHAPNLTPKSSRTCSPF